MLNPEIKGWPHAYERQRRKVQGKLHTSHQVTEEYFSSLHLNKPHFKTVGFIYYLSGAVWWALYLSIRPVQISWSQVLHLLEPCHSNAGVPSGGICSSVLDISFHRIKALAAIASPSSVKRLRTNPRDVISGEEEGRERKRDRWIEEREMGLKRGTWRGGWFKG